MVELYLHYLARLRSLALNSTQGQMYLTKKCGDSKRRGQGRLCTTPRRRVEELTWALVGAEWSASRPSLGGKSPQYPLHRRLGWP
jgi:hypothetical protein